MAESLISFMVQSRTIGRSINSLQSQMSQAGIEVSTGKKQDLVSDLGGEIRTYLDLQSVHTSMQNRMDRLRTGDNRLAQMGLSLETISTQAQDFQPMMAQIGLVDRKNIDVYATQAGNMLESVQNALNVQWGGRYLFSGDEVLKQPMNELQPLVTAVEGIIATHTTTAGGTLTTQSQMDAMITEINQVFDNTHATPTLRFDAMVYNGGTNEMAGIEVADNDVMRFDVKANNSEIREMVRGLVMVSANKTLRNSFADSSSRETNPLEESYLRDALSSISKSEKDMIELQANIGFKQQRIDRIIEGTDRTITHYQTRIGLFENADQYESSVRLQETQRLLESSYYVTAKLGEQSLISYLR